MSAFPFILDGQCSEESSSLQTKKVQISLPRDEQPRQAKLTTIVGVQGDNYAILGTDSRISTLDNDDVRAINLVSHAFQVQGPSSSLKGKKLDEYVTNKFIPALRLCFDVNGYSVPQKDSSEHLAEQGSEMLLAANGCIYQIDNDYAWSTDATGLYSIGTGGEYALGALAVLFSNKTSSVTTAKKNCLTSLSIASKFDPHTGYPYQTFVQEIGTRPAEAKKQTRKAQSR
jgi:ATP-dependent protease HslVU (ClpYQ) peptidase subunit